ncbi:MAG TPA: hypothetical protein VGJ20_41395 [Xanthobacteraceae bacterium]|jgi:hypothetical protein
MGTAAKRRTGRPIKESQKGRRYQIGVIVTGATKAIITKAAKESGRTISREVEILIEKALQYDRMFEDMRMTAEEIAHQSEEAALRRRGYERVVTPDGAIYTPQNFRLHLYLRPAKTGEAK